MQICHLYTLGDYKGRKLGVWYNKYSTHPVQLVAVAVQNLVFRVQIHSCERVLGWCSLIAVLTLGTNPGLFYISLQTSSKESDKINGGSIFAIELRVICNFTVQMQHHHRFWKELNWRLSFVGSINRWVLITLLTTFWSNCPVNGKRRFGIDVAFSADAGWSGIHLGTCTLSESAPLLLSNFTISTSF
jgi:hypothetical protein